MTAVPQSCALRSVAAPCCLPAMPLFSPCSAESKFDLKCLIYRWISALIGWFFGLELKFSLRAGRLARFASAGLSEARPLRLGRERHGLRDRGGLHLAQVAGDVVAGEDFAHRRLLLRAARKGVGAAGVEAAARGWVDRARHVALQDDALARRLGSGTGTADKSASV